MSTRLEVRRTIKLFIGGAFPRSESGRVRPFVSPRGELVANVCTASRKDFRESVRAARAAQPGWAGRTAYNRAQIVYRLAETLESRRVTLAESLAKQLSVGLDAAQLAP
jgi:acyl-CoA reductase-like NAD-dependent aldehyde dehydrogenase